ncbi:hypothetical protein DKK70_08490 [Gilliamella apicola]|uniref:DUF945 domain-containing protein n=1 Tax=Gilliamella apicola TaxID=1196095 RepID=A0A2V4E7G0_9GAMM|nr:DUF945 family protein [Gilliamella apicola]PXZ07021.1 hypothetical protein DKK70_08490 [Gilliamella apicola]
MKKSKLAVGVVAILGLGYVGLAWHTGNVIEKELDNSLNDICQQMNSVQKLFKLQITHDNDEKGIFSTKTHIKISINYDQRFAPIIIYDDDIIIHHGPFPLAALKDGKLTPQQVWVEYQNSEQFNPSLWKDVGNQPFIKGHVGLSYFDNLDFNLLTQPISLGESEHVYNIFQGKLDLGTIDYRFSGNIKFDKSSISIKVSKIGYQRNNGDSLLVNNLKFVNDIDYSKAYIDTQTRFDDLNFDFKTKFNTPEIAIKNLIWHNKFEANSKGLNGMVNLNVDAFNYGKQEMGNGALDFNFEGMDKSFLKHQSELRPLLAKIGNNTSPNSKVNFKKVYWHNNEGDINFNALVDVSNFDQKTALTMGSNLNKLNQFNFKLEAPYKVLGRFIAQFVNPEKENISDEEFKTAVQNVQDIIEMAVYKSPLFIFKKDDVDGLFSEVKYLKNSEQFIINGKKMASDELLKNPTY